MKMEEIIDKHFDILLSWKDWDKPTQSTVTDEELKELEKRLGYNLPSSFKRFLKHKHFVELTIAECEFFSHKEESWLDDFVKKATTDFLTKETKEIYNQRKIPFSCWSTWGHLCFDVTAECKDYEYPIVLWGHERPDEFPKKYENFGQMIFELDKEYEN